MRCVQNKWGAGSCSERSESNPQGKQLEKNLQSMLAERARQDTKWSDNTPKCTSAESKYPSQASSSERDRYAASSQ